MKKFFMAAAILALQCVGVKAMAEQPKMTTLASARDATGNLLGMKVVKLADDDTFARAGLKAGDIIKSLNNKTITSQEDFIKRLGALASQADSADFEVVRGNVRLELHVDSLKADQ